jgi:hypothetical protein
MSLDDCDNPACRRLREDIRRDLERAERQLAEHRRLRTLGGPPPPFTPNWTANPTGKATP